MDDESGASTEEDNMAVVGKGELEIGWGWRSETGSWFQRQGEAYRKERSIICNETDAGGLSESDQRWRATAVRRLNSGDDVVQIRRLGGYKNFECKWQELVFDAVAVLLSQWRQRIDGSGMKDLGSLTTSRAREFSICWKRVIWDLGRL